MKIIKIFSFIAVLFLLFTQISFARSGCCSWHGGVRADGCGCNDGTPLSSTCAPYYTCTVTQPADNSTTYSTPAYVAPTDTPTPSPTATPIPTDTPTPTSTPTPTPKLTATPTQKPTVTESPTKAPTVKPTTAVLGASTKTSAGDVWIGIITLLIMLGFFGGLCFGVYIAGRSLFRKIGSQSRNPQE